VISPTVTIPKSMMIPLEKISQEFLNHLRGGYIKYQPMPSESPELRRITQDTSRRLADCYSRKLIHISYHTSFPNFTSAGPIVVNPIFSYTGNNFFFDMNNILSYIPLFWHICVNSLSNFIPIEKPRKSLSTHNVWQHMVVVFGICDIMDCWVYRGIGERVANT
jgi:hypothetical protein